jgi:20S proteasome subunit alpha 2
MGEAGYSFSLTTFSPSGKLLQLENALKAVQQGRTALGIQGECRPPAARGARRAPG